MNTKKIDHTPLPGFTPPNGPASPLVKGARLAQEAVEGLNDPRRHVERFRYLRRAPVEIAAAMLSVALDDKPSFTKGVTPLPDGRFAVTVILPGSGMELLSCAAHKSGWSLAAFVLDAAVCQAQAIRTECERLRIPFRGLAGELPEDLHAPADEAHEPSPSLRITHGKRARNLKAVE
jgi:hypothetical protein